MPKQYSIAQARHNLAALVHELERKPIIELTRRGKTVAVLLSLSAYRRMHRGTASFREAYAAFRERADLPALRIEPEAIWRDARETGTGRAAPWA